uniref:Transcription initiation factor TFIID subunit 2 n=1 Tax=Picocystis salinarum TaxID=88271 RepID=A0A7S3UED4_9CHLO
MAKVDVKEMAEVLYPRKQKVSIWIDLAKKRLEGCTEITFEGSWTASGKVALHARGLHVKRVSVGNQPAEWNWKPDPERLKMQVSSRTSKNAEYARILYRQIVEEEQYPELEVKMPRRTGNSPCRLIIEYGVTEPERGFRFGADYAFTDMSSPGRASTRYWVPCVEKVDARCTWELLLTVEEGQVVVAGGLLRKMVKSVMNKQHRRTYHFMQPCQTSAVALGMAIGRFGVLADAHIQSITYLAPEEQLEQVKTTVKFLHAPFRLFEQFLSRKFPYDSLQIVFLPREVGLVEGIFAGAGFILASTDTLVDNRVAEAAVDARIDLTFALAQQWFGPMGWAVPGTASDAWITAGLADYLTDLFVTKALGGFESQVRFSKRREAVLQADDGASPPLCPRSVHPALASELLSPTKIRIWRAGAVLRMLQRKVGQEAFRKLVCKFLQTAGPAETERQADGTSHASRSPTVLTSTLTRECHKLCGMAKAEVEAFFQRWICSTGLPRIQAAFAYNKKKNFLEVAIKQEGSPSARAAAQAAVDAGGALGFAGSITLRVAEVDGTFDHVLSLAGEGYVLSTIQVHSRVGSKRAGSRRKRAKDENDPFPDPADDLPYTVPVLWVDLDPEEDWLATVQITQPQSFWINQVRRDTGASSRIRALHGLERSIHENVASGLEVSVSAINALRSVLHDKQVFYRVRMEAASSLTSLGVQGLQFLTEFYKGFNFDNITNKPKANDFEDLSNYFASVAAISAIGNVHTSNRTSPVEAISFLLQLLESNDNSINRFDDSFFVASIIEALGKSRAPNSSTLFQILEEIDGLMVLDTVSPSYQNVVSSACLTALTTLALALPKERRLTIASGIQSLCRNYLESDCVHVSARLSAMKCALQLHFGMEHGLSAIQLLASSVKGENTERMVFAMIQSLLTLLPTAPKIEKCSRRLMQHFLDMVEGKGWGSCPAIQRLVFDMLQKIAGQPLTLNAGDVDGQKLGSPHQPSLKVKLFHRTHSDVGTQPSAAGRSGITIRQPKEVLDEVTKPVQSQMEKSQPDLPKTQGNTQEDSRAQFVKTDTREQQTQKVQSAVEGEQGSVAGVGSPEVITHQPEFSRGDVRPNTLDVPVTAPIASQTANGSAKANADTEEVGTQRKHSGLSLKIKFKPFPAQPPSNSKAPVPDKPSAISEPRVSSVPASGTAVPTNEMEYEVLKKVPKEQMTREQRRAYKLLKRSKKEMKREKRTGDNQ